MASTPQSKFNINWLWVLLTHATSFATLLGAFNTSSTTANAAIKAVALVVQVAVTVGVAVTHSKLLTNVAPWFGAPSAADAVEVESVIHRVLDEKLPVHTRAVVDSVLNRVEAVLPKQPHSTDAVATPLVPPDPDEAPVADPSVG